MCGIAGMVTGSGAIDRRVVARMTRALAHRGPDNEGIVIDGCIGLGHRRLSVIDLSTASNQPMWDTTRRYLIAFNGEIYNYQEVRRELEARGCSFASQGDTETLLVALREWGPAALQRLNGMFALALWDSKTRTLLLARDRLGKKPMFFARLPCGGLAFGSEPRALAQHPALSGTIDPHALAQYLMLNYVPCNRSLLAGIEALPAAHYAEFDVARGLRVTRYWDLAAKFNDKRQFASEQHAAEELRALIDDAVGARLVSDVPLGTLLSGGIDSSTILASMLQHRPASTISTFSSGFVEDSFDESGLAEELALQFGVVHRTQRLDTRAIDLLPSVVAAGGEPLADTSVLPMYFLSQFTRDHVTVALSGDGGDECFGGYETYVADKLHGYARFAPRTLRSGMGKVIDRALPVDHRKVGWSEKLRRFTAALALDFEAAHASWRDIFAQSEVEAVVPSFRARARASADDLFDEYFAPRFAEVRNCHPLDRASYVDIKTWLVDSVLVKADRMSMAHSLEVRCPLLDHRVVEFAAQLPPEYKLRRFAKKRVLRCSQRGRLPDAVLDRPKRGFNAPMSQWILGPLRDLCGDVLYSSTAAAWFDRAEVRRLWNEHEQRRRDNGLKLFGLLTAGLFIQSFTASSQTQALAEVQG